MLPAGGVDALAEVALAVHEPDRDQRQGLVGGLLEQVAGQRAEAAGVDGQRDVDPVLGAQERDRAIGIDPVRRGGRSQIRRSAASSAAAR